MNTQENKEEVKLLPLKTRVAHFGGGPNSHGFGTIVEYNGVKPSAYAQSNLKDAAEIAAAGGMLNGLIGSLYDGVRCPYIVQWDHGYKDVYEPTSVTELTAEVYAKAVRLRFEDFARSAGMEVSERHGPYENEKTERAWQTSKLLIANFSPNRVLEFPIPD